MKQSKVPYQKTLFVCTNVREGKIACANAGRGGDVLCKMLKERVKAAGLKSKVRVARSGCLDRCAEGPNAFLYPDGIWYSGLSEADLPELMKKLSEET